MQYLVMDFGGTLVKYSVMDETCAVFLRGEDDAPVADRAAFLEYLCALYERTCKTFSIGGVEVSMPGVIDAEAGYLRSAGAYSALYGMDLTETLKKWIPVPVSVENDAKCGALAEVWRGNLRDCDDGIVLILGTGVGGGIVKNRKIHRGKNLSAGEFSSFVLGDTAEPRNLAAAKCSVSALLFEAMRRKGIDLRKNRHYEMLRHILPCDQTLSAYDRDPAYDRGMDGHQFFALLEQGDPVIASLYAQYTYSLALLIFNLQISYAPEKVLIGGGISRQARLVPDIHAQYERIRKDAGVLFDLPCCLDVCRFGNEANQYGALYHFLCRYTRTVAEE